MSFKRSVMFIVIVFCVLAGEPAAPHRDAQTRLGEGAITGDTAAIRKAVADGAKLDSLDFRVSRNGRYALNWAAWHNRVDALKLLLELKAPIEAENVTSFTALHHAAESGSLDAARILLAAGANTEHATKSGFKAIDIAQERGNFEIAKLIEGVRKK